jgi:hypothetical protein
MHFWNAEAQFAGHCANPSDEGISGAGGVGGGTCATATKLNIVRLAATISILDNIPHSPTWNTYLEPDQCRPLLPKFFALGPASREVMRTLPYVRRGISGLTATLATTHAQRCHVIWTHLEMTVNVSSSFL